MKLKTITAKSMPDALAEVRRQLGHDAVVLHTRSVKRGGVLGLGARTCVEVTAGDGREIARERSRRRADAKRSAASATAASATPPRSAAAESRRTPEPPRTAGEAHAFTEIQKVGDVKEEMAAATRNRPRSR